MENDIKIKNKSLLSYLFGYWLGDGCRTSKQLSFSIEEKKKDLFINRLNNTIENIGNIRYYLNTELCISKCNQIKKDFQDNIIHYNLAFEYPWHFLAGFLESDGWVQYQHTKNCKDTTDNRVIEVCFGNTSVEYLEIIKKVLDYVNLPYRECISNYDLPGTKKIICGKECNVNKKSHILSIAGSASTYIFANKIIPILLYNDKKDRLLNFINYYNELWMNSNLPVSEIFFSINGEGNDMGVPMQFLRLQGCRMHCYGCDTQYSWENPTLNSDKQRKLSDIMNEILNHESRKICITGGDVFIHRNKLAALIAFLKSNDFYINLQSNGATYDRIIFNLVDCVDMDIKTPCFKTNSDVTIINKLRPKKDVVKFVINDDIDYNYATEIKNKYYKKDLDFILQPMATGESLNEYKEKCKWLVEKMIDNRDNQFRVLPQFHRIMWGQKRGI